MIYRKSHWYSVEACVSCGERLTDNEKLYSKATCPYCGHTVNGSICETRKMVIRQLYHYPKWKFWKSDHTWEGKNEDAANWINLMGFNNKNENN